VLSLSSAHFEYQRAPVVHHFGKLGLRLHNPSQPWFPVEIEMRREDPSMEG
jgi:hypothetical protein